MTQLAFDDLTADDAARAREHTAKQIAHEIAWAVVGALDVAHLVLPETDLAAVVLDVLHQESVWFCRVDAQASTQTIPVTT